MIDINVTGWKRGDHWTASVALFGEEIDVINLIDSLCHADLPDGSPAAKLRDALMDGLPLVSKTWPPAGKAKPKIIGCFHGTGDSAGGGWYLTDAATVEIEGIEYPIPARHSNGGVLAPWRITETIKAAGYRPYQDEYYDSIDADGPRTIALERMP